MKYVFTAHARVRMLENDIIPSEVIEAIEQPKTVRKGKIIGRFEVEKKFAHKRIQVIYRKQKWVIIIITTFNLRV